MEIILKLKNRVVSYIKILTYKVLFRQKLKINNIMKSYILENSKIYIGKNGKIEFKDAPLCRENVKFNVNNGTLIIGNNTFINKDSSINVREEVSIGNNCLIGENVRIYDHDHVFDLNNNILEANLFKTSKIKIGNNVFIGNEAVILPGVTIGDNCVIGARAVVTKNIENNSVVAGIPAKKICDIEEYWNKNKNLIDNTKNLNSEEKKKYLYNKFDIE